MECNLNRMKYNKERIDIMDEVTLINMLSYLDSEILDNDYIESDSKGLIGSLNNIIFIFAGLALVTGVMGVGLIMKKNTKVNFGKTKSRLPKALNF